MLRLKHSPCKLCVYVLVKAREDDPGRSEYRRKKAGQRGDVDLNTSEHRGVAVGGCILQHTVTACHPYSDSPHSHPARNQFRYIHLCPV